MNFSGNPTTTTATGFTFGQPTFGQAGAGTNTFGTSGGGDAGTTTAASKGFSFGAQPATTISTLFVTQPAPAATTTTASQDVAKGFSFGAITTAATPSFSFGTQPTSVVATTTKATTVDATTSQKATETTSLTTTTKTTDSHVASHAGQINFSQLEEHINKWTLELEEQEKVFTNQATQINAWDKLLIANNDKIVALNDAVQKVKAEQQTLEQELEFISTQHAELEESIAPLQKEFQNMPQVDVERTQIYHLVENLDTQLKQMSEDLKEVIEYLNEANKAQDSTDPVVQIGKILNAHMNSLQWIENSSTTIATKLDELSKIQESLRRDSERSFRLTYYD